MVLRLSYRLYASLCCDWHYDTCFYRDFNRSFFLFRNVFDQIGEKWYDRWQYYKVIGVKSLRKAVTVALCIVSITFALIAGMCIPLDINVVS